MAQSPDGVTLLLIEDDANDIELAKTALRSPRLRILCATTLAQARAVLRAYRVAVIVLDLGLRDSQGVTTVADLSAAFPKIPIVVLTGTQDEATRAAALQQGARAYLVKGDGDALLGAVLSAL
jgi:DNA-binding response OmpR family regulator